MRALNRQPKQLIREFSGLMIAVATVDTSDQGASGLAEWVSNRVEPLTEPIKQYIASHPPVTLDKAPTPKQRFRSYHKITIHLMALGAQPETITEVQNKVDERLAAVKSEPADRAARIPEQHKSHSSRSRSHDHAKKAGAMPGWKRPKKESVRLRPRKGGVVPFPKPPTIQ